MRDEDTYNEDKPTSTRQHRVMFHYPTSGKEVWINPGRYVARVPVVGEHFALSSNGPWFRVELVVHCAFGAEFVAEVYGVEADGMTEQLKRIRAIAGLQ